MVKISITASHDGGNIEVISIGETVISGRTAKVTVTLHIKPGEFFSGPGHNRHSLSREGGAGWRGDASLFKSEGRFATVVCAMLSNIVIHDSPGPRELVRRLPSRIRLLRISASSSFLSPLFINNIFMYNTPPREYKKPRRVYRIREEIALAVLFIPSIRERPARCERCRWQWHKIRHRALRHR